METFILTTLLYSFFVVAHGELFSHLLYYEKINKNDIYQHKVKRSLNEENFSKRISFNSHGEHFRLNLLPSHEIFSPSFEAVVINKKQEEEKVSIDKSLFYHGYDELHSSSEVIAHIEDGMIDAKISTSDETYFIEPMWRHDHPTHDMIVYKASNVNSSLSSNSSFCHAPNTSFNNSAEKHSKSRQHRSTNTFLTKNNTCKMILVADYTYFENRCGRNEQKCAHMMLQIIMRVNRIYRKTDWKGVGTNIGVQVKKVVIYQTPSKDQKASFNEARSNWNANSVLHEFAFGDWKGYCLAHLFTSRDFPDETLGLAYIGSTSANAGICAKGYLNQQGKMRYQNCALTTNIDKGKRLLNVESDLVTAHEIAHNFGSYHDEASRCLPPKTNGGKFLMYPRAVKGESLNNYRFSICSIEEISKILKVKRLQCFTDESVSHCGNGVVEDGEQCDSGYFGGNSSCCDTNCRFHKSSFQCNDVNDDCCVNCTIAPPTMICKSKSQILCRESTFCDGMLKDCPQSSPQLSGGSCGFSKGICVMGKCKNLCELEQPMMYRCICPNPEECKICCQSSNSTSSLCIPLVSEGSYQDENDGVPCDNNGQPGECMAGKCQKIVKNVEDEFTALLDDFSISNVERVFSSNIVFIALIVSIVIWIPLSCIVNQIDKGRIKLNS